MKLTDKIFTLPALTSTLITILKNLSVQRSFLEENIKEVLSGAEEYNDGSLDSADFKKITGYYGLAVPAILGEAFCALHGKKMSFNERMAATSQGAMTGLFDDFFDKQYISQHSIKTIISNQDSIAKRSNEKLFNIFYKKALQYVPDKEKMREALSEVYKAQVESKKQVNDFLTEKEIRDITFYKGGISLLFYRTAFLPDPSEKEEKLLYNLGSLMQLANDIFDVYKDRQSRIKTLVTEAMHIKDIEYLLRTKLSEYYAAAYDMGASIKHVKKFLSILSLGIFSRAFVCLNRLKKNEQLTNNKFSVHQYSRKQLICDMDIKINMLRSTIYYIELMSISPVKTAES